MISSCFDSVQAFLLVRVVTALVSYLMLVLQWLKLSFLVFLPDFLKVY